MNDCVSSPSQRVDSSMLINEHFGKDSFTHGRCLLEEVITINLIPLNMMAQSNALISLESVKHW